MPHHRCAPAVLVTTLAALAAAVPAAEAAAQDINIDFGLPSAGPSATYAAAGRPGVWNAIEGEHTPFQNPEVVYSLVDHDGAPTDVILWQFGGLELFALDDPFINGDHAALVEDGLITFNSSLEVCLWIEGLEDGCYEVLMYGHKPGSPAARTKMRHDFNPPSITIGGAWPGGHAEGVTYSRHVVEVTNNFLGSHAGVGPGGSPILGGVLNGMQIRRLLAEDLDGDGVVGIGDLIQLLAAWGDCPAGCPEDLDADGSVGIGDLVTLLAAWG